MNQHQRSTGQGLEYHIGDGYYVSERGVCHHCIEQQEAAGKPYRENEQRYSFGIYAGRYCDECWPKSGYRDATDPTARFDPLDAGEVLEPWEY